MKKIVLRLLLLMLLATGGARAIAQPSSTDKFLFISDVHLNPQSQSTNYGDDAGMDLWGAFKAKIDTIMSGSNAPRFILYTGDLPVHNGWCSTLTGEGAAVHDTAISLVLTRLRNMSVQYGKPVFYMPGNNDALSGDYLSFTDSPSGKSPLSFINPSPLFFPKNSQGKSKGPAYLISENKTWGYYSAKVMPGLRMIALNTVIFNNGCPFNGRPQQCAAEMRWLRSQLSAAKHAGDKVYIAMHVPPGNSWGGGPAMWNTSGGVWVDTFLQMVANYSPTISGIFYGHTHMDEMRRLHIVTPRQQDTITKIAICCPGISAQHGNNPGFKVVTYDSKTKEPVDFTTMYTPLPLEGPWQGNSYTFRQIFGCNKGTVYSCLKDMPTINFATLVASIYNVMSNQSSVTADNVINFVDVEPQ